MAPSKVLMIVISKVLIEVPSTVLKEMELSF